MTIILIILAIIFILTLILQGEGRKECNCECCKNGEPGWLSEEYRCKECIYYLKK